MSLTTSEKLTEAKDALHSLMTGAQTVSVHQTTSAGSRSVQYTQTNIQDLRSYIRELESLLEIETDGHSSRRPFGVAW